MEQLKTPNFSTQGQAGWCLWTAEEAFGVPHLYATAEDAYNQAQFKHAGAQPPNAIVPVYWTYYDLSLAREFGHIAIWVPGKGVFSSPFDKSYGNQWFSSIQAVTDRINQIKGANSRYLGWSEDLAGVRIVQETVMNKGDVINMYEAVLGRTADASGLKSYVGKPFNVVFYALVHSAEYANHQAKLASEAHEAAQVPALQKQIADLQAQLKAKQAQSQPQPSESVSSAASNPAPAPAPTPKPQSSTTSRKPPAGQHRSWVSQMVAWFERYFSWL